MCLDVIKRALVVAILLSCNCAFADEINKSVYIDPYYGGREIGPDVYGEQSAKDLTLILSNTLKTMLISKGVKAILSRSSDSDMTLEERVSSARLNQVDIYVALNVSSSDKDCLILEYPNEKKLREETRLSEGDLSDLIDKQIVNAVVLRSNNLSTILSNAIKKETKIDCIYMKSTDNYILNNAFTTTLILNFNIGHFIKMESIFFEQTFMDEVLKIITRELKDYNTLK